jgi:hypothetical protein
MDQELLVFLEKEPVGPLEHGRLDVPSGRESWMFTLTAFRRRMCATACSTTTIAVSARRTEASKQWHTARKPLAAYNPLSVDNGTTDQDIDVFSEK